MMKNTLNKSPKISLKINSNLIPKNGPWPNLLKLKSFNPTVVVNKSLEDTTLSPENLPSPDLGKT